MPSVVISTQVNALLRYMAQRMHVTLYLLDEPVNPLLPLLYSSEEGHKYTPRIAMYGPQELLLNGRLRDALDCTPSRLLYFF